MTLSDARKILGLGPDEDPRPHMAEFRLARERIAEMVRNAPNPTLGERYQQGLIEFDQALAAVREYLEALGLIPRLEESDRKAEPPAPTRKLESPEDQTPGESEDPQIPRRRALAWLLWTLVVLSAAAGGGWIYFKNEESRMLQCKARIALLERLGSEYVENRRWQEAAKAFAEIESLAPGSDIAAIGRRSIEAGMTEEQTQFVGYWTGQAIAELDAGRLDEAEAAARRVIERFPDETEPRDLLQRIAVARAGQSRDKTLAAARRQLADHQWDAAIQTVTPLLDDSADDPEATAIIADANAAIAKQQADRAKAEELLEQAAARDNGQFDQQALDWLREAASLAPDHAAIKARLEKMASYTRTLNVPGDFDTPAEALAAARDRDRIVLAEHVWKGPLVVTAAVDLQGAGSGKTIVECGASDGSVITIGPEAKGARITGITFRHEKFLAQGKDRFSVALVRGGGATFTDCRFCNSSGHGLVVIEHGEAIAGRCQFTDNGWNGAAAIGGGAYLEVRDSESLSNFEHGIESWGGAAVKLVNNRCEGNSRNGIHADNGAAAATIEGNRLVANREFGLVLDSAGSGMVSGNTARANLLGGLVIRTPAAAVRVTGNQASLNQGPGIVLERGLPAAAYADNKATQNKPREILTDAVLSQPDDKPASPQAEKPHGDTLIR